MPLPEKWRLVGGQGLNCAIFAVVVLAEELHSRVPLNDCISSSPRCPAPSRNSKTNLACCYLIVIGAAHG